MQLDDLLPPSAAIKRQIILNAILNNDHPWVDLSTGDAIDEAWDDFDNNYDYVDEFRTSGIETGGFAPSSRHFECDAVARKLADGNWVEWNYWHGGGKHGEPEGIDWFDDARYIKCVEEERVTTVLSFKPLPQKG